MHLDVRKRAVGRGVFPHQFSWVQSLAAVHSCAQNALGNRHLAKWVDREHANLPRGALGVAQ